MFRTGGIAILTLTITMGAGCKGDEPAAPTTTAAPSVAEANPLGNLSREQACEQAAQRHAALTVAGLERGGGVDPEQRARVEQVLAKHSAEFAPTCVELYGDASIKCMIVAPTLEAWAGCAADAVRSP